VPLGRLPLGRTIQIVLDCRRFVPFPNWSAALQARYVKMACLRMDKPIEATAPAIAW